MKVHSTLCVYIDCIDTYSSNNAGVCHPCPVGAVCKHGNISALENYRLIYASDNSVTVFKCPESFCKADQQCYPHRHGWLCELCDEGYVAFGKSCIECSQTNGGFVFLFLLVLFLISVALLLISGRGQSGYPKIFIYFVQMISLVINPVRSWLLSFIDIFNSGFSSADVCVGVIDYYGKISVKLMLPFMSTGYIAIIYCVHAIVMKIRKNHIPNVHQYFGCILNVLIFFYMSIATTCLNYLHCETVAGEYVNVYEPSIHCDSAKYKDFSVIVYFIFLTYTICFPIGTILLLFWGWKRKKLTDPYFSNHYGALYKAYKTHQFWWEDVVLLRKLVLVTVFVFVANISQKQVRFSS